MEDNDLNQEVASALLHQVGLSVTITENGAIAVDKVRSEDFDIVFMDMQMPVMDGLDATRRIRQLAGRESLPIIAMTANAMAGDRDRCLAAGMNDYIPKPITPDDLWAALRRWISPTGEPPAESADTVPPSAEAPETDAPP